MKTRQHRAFTLVEVVLAMGIVAFALVTMVGLIPVGLGTMRDAMDNTTVAQISQRIQSQIITTPFESINSQLNGKVFYFDQEGFQQTAAGATTRFQVNLTTASSVYPGAPSGKVDDSIKEVRLQMIYYGRNVANGNTVAANVTFNVPNQSGGSGLTPN